MILILTNQAVFVFCNIVCGNDTSIGAPLTLNQADVIGDQSDAVTQNVWFRCTLCAATSGEISIFIQIGGECLGEGFLYQESAVGRVLLDISTDYYQLNCSFNCAA